MKIKEAKRRKKIAKIVKTIKDFIIYLAIFYGIATIISCLYWFIFVYLGW